MLVSLEVTNVSPRLELIRNGHEVTVDLESGANGYYDPDLGYWIWDGDIEATLGTVSDYYYTDFDRPLDLTITETLTPGVAVDGSYAINYGELTSSFKVILFDAAADYAGTDGIDYVFGSHLADKLSGGLGNDGLEGGMGDDWLNGGKGGDLADGGAGRDIASYAGASHAVVARLYDSKLNDGEAKGDRYVSIEVLEGSRFNDHLYGDGKANTLWGRDGADTLFGLRGSDTLAGGKGADLLLGDFGVDTASYAEALEGVTVRLEAGSGSGGEAAGDQYWSIENVTGSSFADSLSGDDGANTLLGRAGDDSLRGYTGNDRLFGASGDDHIIAGTGDDTVFGGDGFDRLSGQRGADQFVFDSALTPSGNADRIADYVVADDQIRLGGAVFTELAAGGLSAGAFTIGAAAGAASHRIIYNNANGQILYDADGVGGADAVVFALASVGLAMTAAEFFVL